MEEVGKTVVVRRWVGHVHCVPEEGCQGISEEEAEVDEEEGCGGWMFVLPFLPRRGRVGCGEIVVGGPGAFW